MRRRQGQGGQEGERRRDSLWGCRVGGVLVCLLVW